MPKDLDDIKLWKERIRVSKEFQKKKGATEDWKRYVDLFNNKQWAETFKAEDRVTVNMIYALVSTAKPMLYFKNPRILVIPKKEEYRPGAEIAERALNYEWIEHRLKEKIKLSILDGLLISHGWIKQVYYDDKIHALRVSPFDMFVDPMAGSDWRASRYLIHRTFKSLEDVKANPNYENTKNLKTSSKMTEVIFGQYADKEGLSDDTKRVELWEIHDREKGKIRVMATDHDKWLRNEKHPYECEDFIFEMLRLIEVPDHFYPMSSIAPVESPCKELNKTRTQLINHRKRHKRILLFDKQVLTPDNLEDIEKSEALSLIGVDGREAVQGSIQPVPDPPLGADIYQIEQVIKGDIREIYGQSEYQRSAQAPGVETATEAMMIERGTRLRPDEMLDIIQDFCVDIAKKRLQMMKQFYTSEHMYRFADEMGQVQWGSFTKEDIQGEYDVDIEIASTMPWSEETRRKFNMDALNLLSNPGLQVQLQREGFEIKVSELVKGVLKDLRLPDTSRVLVPFNMQQGSPAPLLPGEAEGGPMDVQKLQEKIAPNEGEAQRRGIARAGGVLGGTPGIGQR
jgi:hypothetical protein